MPPTSATSSDGAGAGAATAVAGTEPKYTWQEVAKHNSAESAWVIVNGIVYDLTPFLDKHPGGRELLLLAAGRECTDLFTMYHVFNNEKATKYLATYRVGVFTGPSEFPVYKPEPRGGFYYTLRDRVVAHFKATGKDPKSPVPGLLRVVPLLMGAALTFAIIHGMLWKACPWPVKLLLAAVYGVLQVLPLMHWLHDASHASIGYTQTWWRALGCLTMDWVAGGNMLPWMHQHVIGHHVYTNVFGTDPDLPMAEKDDMRRLVPRQVWKSLYKWQWIYLPILYGLLGMKIRIQDITEFLINRMNGPIRVNWYGNAPARVIVPKIAWVIWRILVPLVVLRVPVGEFLALLVVSDLASGYWLAYNFQVSHITEDVAWPCGDAASPTMPDTWAENQVKTGLDYDHESSVTRFLAGALNYQIEHHLFPGISQYHYPAIAPIVQQTCKEFGLPYRYERSFWGAFTAHIGYLKRMGEAGKAAHMD